VAVLAKNRLDDLSDFVKEPNNSSYARNIALTAAEHVAHYYPELRERVIEMFRDWFEFHLHRLDDDRFIDTQLLSFMVWSCMNLNADELLGQIRRLYDENLISITMLGSYKDVENDIHKDSYASQKPSGIIKAYKQFQGKTQLPDFSEPVLPNTNTLPDDDDLWRDVGRNDPCPCGSGRKFKKCCLRK